MGFEGVSERMEEGKKAKEEDGILENTHVYASLRGCEGNIHI